MAQKFDPALHESVWAVYRDTVARNGNTAAAFSEALAVVRRADPLLAADEARRKLAAMIATEPDATLQGARRASRVSRK